MKKSLFITIAILVIVSILCFTAFADSEQIDIDLSSSTSATHDVSATIDSLESIYCITVEFGDMIFSYSSTWNPVTLQYENVTWETEDNKIIITNKSNVSVKIAFGYTEETDFDDISAYFVKEDNLDNWQQDKTNSTYGIGTKYSMAEYDSQNGANTLSAYLNLEGNTNALESGKLTKIGTVTVTAYAAE